MVKKMKVPETPAPEPGDDSWEAFAQLSQRFQEHTALEIEKKNRLQASEKVWASVGCALTAVAKQRGWKHDSYEDKHQVARQIGMELADADSSLTPSPRTRRAMQEHREEKIPEITSWFNAARNLHTNFRENTYDLEQVKEGQTAAAKLLEKLGAVLEKDRQTIPINRHDQWRLARLTGLDDEANRINRESGQGAMEKYLDGHFPLYKKIEWGRDDQRGDDDGGETQPVARPPSGSPSPEGSRAKPIPQSGQGATPKVNLKPGKQLGQGDAVAEPPSNGRRTRRSRSKDEQPTSVNITFG